MAGPAGTNWSGSNHSGQHDDPLPGVHETSEMGGVIGGVILMVRPSTATPITPVAMAGAAPSDSPS